MLTANNVPSIKASKPSDILEITKLLPTRLHLFSNCFITDLAAIVTLNCYNIPIFHWVGLQYARCLQGGLRRCLSIFLYHYSSVSSLVRRRQSVLLFMALVLRSLLLVWSLESISALINCTPG